jgi:RNA polymerase sigma factor (sigma-70 family)
MKTGGQNEAGDADLIRRLKRGEQGAFDGLFDRYRGGLIAYAEGLLRDHALAEDVVQDVFVALVRHADSLRPASGAAGWLYRATRNRAFDVLRRARRERERVLVPEGAEPTVESEADRRLDAVERATLVRTLVDALSQPDRELVLLRFYGGLTFREIACVVRRPLGTVLWRMRRILREMSTRAEVREWRRRHEMQ